MWDEFLKYTKEIYEAFGIAFASFLMAFTMALIRTKRKHGKADWLEAGMCGLFAIGTWSLLMWFNVPEMVAVGAASAIGFKGTHFVSDLIDKKQVGKMKLIDNWKQSYKLKSVQVGALSAFFYALILFSEQFLNVWFVIPQELKNAIPEQWKEIIGCFVGVAMILARLKKQPELHGDDE